MPINVAPIQFQQVQLLYHQQNQQMFSYRSISPKLKNQPSFNSHIRQASRSPITKQISKWNTESKTASTTSTSNTLSTKSKTKDKIGYIYLLEEIYSQISFTEYDAFSEEKIIKARDNLVRLIQYYNREQPICPKHLHLLNLFCQNDKSAVCIGCVYKGNPEHKSHRIKPIESAEKIIQYETIQLQEKCRSYISQLSQIQKQTEDLFNNLDQNFMMTSNYSTGVINEVIKELQNLKQEYQYKLEVSYRRAQTIIKRYQKSIGSMLDILESNLQNISDSNIFSKHLIVKELNKFTGLIQELVSKYQENKAACEKWKQFSRDTQKLIMKKKYLDKDKDSLFFVQKF